MLQVEFTARFQFIIRFHKINQNKLKRQTKSVYKCYYKLERKKESYRFTQQNQTTGVVMYIEKRVRIAAATRESGRKSFIYIINGV